VDFFPEKGVRIELPKDDGFENTSTISNYRASMNHGI